MPRFRAVLVAAGLFLGGGIAVPQPGARMESRSYDCSALVGAIQSWPFVLEPHGNLVLGQRRPDPEEWDGLPLFGGAQGDGEPRRPSKAQPVPDLGSDLPLRSPGSDFRAFERPCLDGEALVGLLATRLFQAKFDPSVPEYKLSWTGNQLRVQAPAAAHTLVQELLTPLLDAASAVIVTECVLVPHGVLDKLQPEWRTRGALLDEKVLEEAILDPGARLLTVTSRNGQRVATGTKDFQSFVVDQEVNQTGVIPVINPIVGTPFAGDRLEVRASLVPGSSGVLLDLAVGSATATATTAILGSEWGNLDLPRTDEGLFSISFVIPPGKAMVAAALDSDRVGGTTVLVRSRLRKRPASPGAPAGAATVRLHELAVFLEASPQRRWPSARAQDRFSPRQPPFDQSSLLSLLGIPEEDQSIVRSWDATRLLLSAPADALAAYDQTLAREAARLTQMVAVDLQMLTVPRALLAHLRSGAEDLFLLPRDWEKALPEKQQVERRRCFLAGVAGQVHAVRRASVATYVVGCSQISGGTGFAIVERSDPETDTCGAGLELRVQATLPQRDGVARLQVEGCETKITAERRVKASFPLVSILTGDEGAATNTQGHVGVTLREIQLTLPRQAVTPWNVDLELPLDRDAILQSSAGEGETATVLIGRVRRLP